MATKEIYIVPKDNTYLQSEREHTLFLNKGTATAEQISEPGYEERGGWYIHGSGVIDYEESFAAVLPRTKPLRKVMREIGSHPNAAVLDLMASDAYVREAVEQYGFEFGLAVSLGFQQSTERVERGIVRNVNGDLLRSDTWDQIRDTINRRGMKGFDLIISRPEGGISYISLLAATHFRLLQEAWRLLSADNGVMLFQAPNVTFERYSAPYLLRLQQAGMATVVYHYLGDQSPIHPVKLVKTKHSPEILPTPKMLGMMK